jgi:hypothetical protein
LSYWRTGCRVLGKVLGEPTRRLGNPLVKPNSGAESAEIAPRRSPVRVRLAPSLNHTGMEKKRGPFTGASIILWSDFGRKWSARRRHSATRPCLGCSDRTPVPRSRWRRSKDARQASSSSCRIRLTGSSGCCSRPSWCGRRFA